LQQHTKTVVSVFLSVIFFVLWSVGVSANVGVVVTEAAAAAAANK
jgi:hypothetical protein